MNQVPTLLAVKDRVSIVIASLLPFIFSTSARPIPTCPRAPGTLNRVRKWHLVHSNAFPAPRAAAPLPVQGSHRRPPRPGVTRGRSTTHSVSRIDMRGVGPKLHPGRALGPRGGSCSSDTWVSPCTGPPAVTGMATCQGLWQGQRWPWGQPTSSCSAGRQVVLAGRAVAARRLSPHFRTGSGPAAQVTADNISARASISHWQSTFFPKERQK